MKPLLLSLAAITLLCHCAAPFGGGSGDKAALTSATKEQPFVNSLGMKFVPVPGTNILMCTTETTVAQYQQSGRSYQTSNFPQESNHPAVNVSWNDAVAYCKWLSKRDGHTYRLPTDNEWSAAVGGTTYPWGNNWPPPNNAENLQGQEMRQMSELDRKQHLGVLKRVNGAVDLIAGFHDRHLFTSQTGTYSTNILGIQDLGGNVSEWCADPVPNAAAARIVRGGAWDVFHRGLLASSFRHSFRGAKYGYGDVGFRIVTER